MHLNRYKRTHKELEIITLDCYTIQWKRQVKSKSLDVTKAYIQAVNCEESICAKKSMERSVSLGVVVSLCEGM